MKGLLIRNGDLVVAPGGYEMIDGEAKVKQDLGIAVREPFGHDRFHPRYGTVLTEYVGREVNETTAMLIRSEISRVIQNYVHGQTEAMGYDAARRRPPRFGPGEIISGIEKIDIRQELDRFNVKVTVTTLMGARVNLLRTVRV